MINIRTQKSVPKLGAVEERGGGNPILAMPRIWKVLVQLPLPKQSMWYQEDQRKLWLTYSCNGGGKDVSIIHSIEICRWWISKMNEKTLFMFNNSILPKLTFIWPAWWLVLDIWPKVILSCFRPSKNFNLPVDDRRNRRNRNNPLKNHHTSKRIWIPTPSA